MSTHTHDDAATVIVAEANDLTREFLAAQLTADGFAPLLAQTAAKARALARTRYPDLLILGELEDGAAAPALLRELRAASAIADDLDPELPVIAIGANDKGQGQLRAFEAGADDYLTRPFSYPELLARVRAVLRRCQRRPRRGIVKLGQLVVDPGGRLATYGDLQLELSNLEFSLLHRLASDPTRVFTKAELLREVWGFEAMGSTRTLDSHACRLRRKLNTASGRRFVINVWGVGYRLIDGVLHQQ